jgi:probable rRNA maturation factor
MICCRDKFMIEPEINISIKRNIDLPVEKSWLKGIARRVLEAESITSSAEMGLLITDSQTIQKLNRIYRGEDKHTDVLAFQMTPGMNQEPELSFVSAPDGIKHLGEVVISYPQAEKQAQEQGHGVTRELALLIVHGILHLLGYDHELPEEEQKMRNKENKVLSILELT